MKKLSLSIITSILLIIGFIKFTNAQDSYEEPWYDYPLCAFTQEDGSIIIKHCYSPYDLNYDGEVSATDALLVLKKAVDLEE